ncbi:MAG: DNA alkylation repair protein [Clostridiales bacterium]
MNRERIKLELKNIFRRELSQNQKDYIKADLIKKLWINCYNDDENELSNSEDNEKLNFSRGSFDTLKFIGKEIVKIIKDNSLEQLQLVKILWRKYGKEGRTISIYILGQIHYENPETTLDFIKEVIKKCISVEECDNISTKVIEPVALKDIDRYLKILDFWSKSENKWLRRSAMTVLGRIPMKKPIYTNKSLEIVKNCLCDIDNDVMKSVSLALRLSIRGNSNDLKIFIVNNAYDNNSSKIWIFTDFIINLNKKYLLEFHSQSSTYTNWYNKIDENNKVTLSKAIKVLSNNH